MENLHQFYENIFSNDAPNSNKSISNYLKNISLLKISTEQRELCEGKLTQKEGKDKTIRKTIMQLLMMTLQKNSMKSFGLKSKVCFLYLSKKFLT